MKKYIDIFPTLPKKNLIYREREEPHVERKAHHLKESIHEAMHEWGEYYKPQHLKRPEW
jgi:hypothetical protein